MGEQEVARFAGSVSVTCMTQLLGAEAEALCSQFQDIT